MSALPCIPLIDTQPILRPDYIVNASTMRSPAAFLELNGRELERYYDQLRAVDPLDFCSREEFYLTQYDIQRQYWLKWANDARSERREHYSNIEPNTGLRRYGEI